MIFILDAVSSSVKDTIYRKTKQQLDLSLINKTKYTLWTSAEVIPRVYVAKTESTDVHSQFIHNK